MDSLIYIKLEVDMGIGILSGIARSAKRKKKGHSVRVYLTVTAENRSGARPKGPHPEAGRAEVKAEC